ncbi:hypothetical protein GCM10027074_51040 [Streptomyces deserti]
MSGAVLASDPRVREAVGAIGVRYGADYTDDAAVTALLEERRRAVEAVQRGPLQWLTALAVMVGVVLLMPVPAFATHRSAALGLAGALFIAAVALALHLRNRWKRELTHPALTGYRQVLGTARAHGISLTHVPAWLEGRSASGGGKGATPIPSYPAVEPVPPAEPLPDQQVTPGSVPPKHPVAAPPKPAIAVPPKPPAVDAYERIADAGGWHDEAGCLLVFAGAGGAIWAATSDNPLGYGTLVLVPLAIAVWLAGSRQGNEKERLRAEAVAYVRAVADAQAAGARVPELPPALKPLVDE